MDKGIGVLDVSVQGSVAEGVDRDTKFFHQATVEKRTNNTIRRLQKNDGTWTENKDEIIKGCEGYFRKKFQTEGCRGVAE